MMKPPVFSLDRLKLIFVCALVVVTSACIANQAPIYDESGNGQQLLDAALKTAKTDSKHVLVQWGGNWCGWCYVLHDVMKSDKSVSNKLASDYVLLLIDSQSNGPLMEKLAPDAHAVPYLTVLDADGKVLANQETGSFVLNGSSHDPGRVLAFLEANGVAGSRTASASR